MSGILKRDFAKKKCTSISTTNAARSRKIGTHAIFFVAVLWTGLLVYRLLALQIFGVETWQGWATKQHSSEVKVAAERGSIVDRNGKLLAVSIPAGSIYVRPKQILDKERAADALGSLLNIQKRDLLKILNQNKSFVWVKRLVPRTLATKIEELKIAGVGYLLESRRSYPYGKAGSVVIGRVSIDGNGLSGIEKSYEKILQEQASAKRMERDALGKAIHVSSDGEFSVPKGEAVELTLDADIQAIVDEEIEAGRKAAGAKRAIAVLVDSKSGDIWAMSQSPAPNFNADSVINPEALKNIIVETVYEPGSTMKPLIAAAAIEAGVAKPNDLFNCEHGRYFYGGHLIKDVHPIDTVSLHDVVVKSSNIGMTKVGDRLGKERLYDALKTFGFGQATDLKLPGETGGILRNVSGWSKVDVATHSFGQGVAVTPLQMVRAMSAIANGGVLVPLHLVKKKDPGAYPRIISTKTAEQVQSMLYDVVESDGGTGKLARIPGVTIGGKTGTAQKASQTGGYQQGAYVASFVGFANATSIGVQNRLTLMVVVDEPSAGSIYGGMVAAPVFQRTMERVLRHLVMREELGSPNRNNREYTLSKASYTY